MIKQKTVHMIVAAFVFTWGFNRANAEIIVNTFGPGLSHGTSGIYSLFDLGAPDELNYFVTAQAFRTPAYSTTLTRAIVPFLMDDSAGNISPVRMSIWTGVDGFGSGFIDVGLPLGFIPSDPTIGDLAADLTNRSVLVGGSPSEPTVFSYVTNAPVLLDADTMYFLVAQVIQVPGTPRGTNTWFESAFSHQYLISGFVGENPNNFENDKFNVTNSFDPNGVGLAMQIEVQAVPEPSALWMFAVASLPLFALRRRISTR